MLIRPLIKNDLPRVISIEQANQLFPWSEEIFQRYLMTAAIKGFVLEEQNFIVGFIILKSVVDECEILNISIDPLYQRQGYGHRLLEYVIQEYQLKQNQTLFLEVRASNFKAIHLYEKNSFEKIAVRKSYYPTIDGREDAWILKRTFKKKEK